MILNEKIVNLLKEHPEGGEKFFNALDLLVRSDRDILDDFVEWAVQGAKEYKTRDSLGLVITGKFGNAIISNFPILLNAVFSDIIIVNGGIRTGAVPEIYKTSFKAERFVFFDDSLYSGTTMKKIEKAMQEINKEVHIIHSWVIYDGGHIVNSEVSSLYRYYG